MRSYDTEKYANICNTFCNLAIKIQHVDLFTNHRKVVTRLTIYVKACSHRTKPNAKAKKTKEQLEQIKGKIPNIKENFRFRFRVC